jgi:MFS family permease
LPRQFWWLWTITLISRIGTFVAIFMALYLTRHQGYSASYAGVVISLFGIGGVVSSIGAGMLADRFGRRPVLLFAQVATAAFVAALGFMSNPVVIAVLMFLVGVAGNATLPAAQAMTADIVGPVDRGRAFALYYWATNMGFAISAMAVGQIAQLSYLAGFLGEAGTALLCAVLVFFTVSETRPRSGHRIEMKNRKESTSRPWDVLQDTRILGVVLLTLLTALIFQQVTSGLPIAMGVDGFSTAAFGLVTAVNCVLVLALQLPAAAALHGRDLRWPLIASALLAGYGFGLTAFAHSLGGYVATVGVWTLAEVVAAPAQASLVVQISPVHARASYQGLNSAAWSAAGAIAPLLSGLAIAQLGAGWLWGGCAVVGTVAGFGYWLLVRALPVTGSTDRPNESLPATDARTPSPP